MAETYASAVFSRSRISLPVLKNGTCFLSTETWAPVAAGAGRTVLDREGAEAAQLDPVAARECVDDLAKDGVDDIFDVTLVEVRILCRNALYEF